MKTAVKSLLLLALAGFVFTGCATNHCGSCKMAQWEYKTEVLVPFNSDAKLNELGKEGWVLVSVLPSTIEINSNNDKPRHDLNNCVYVFKRLKH